MGSALPRDPAGQAAADSPRWEVAHVFRLYGDAYRAAHPLPESHQRVMDDIARCRTAALGGHVEQCDACAFERPVYNSCHNRHCPKCQALPRAKWVEARRAELLPTGYFHMVFTLPHELNPLALANKRVVFNRFFQSVSAVLQDFGRRVLGGRIGFTAILHTWDQKLLDHIHVHCLIPGGALSPDQQHWLPSEERFLFDVLDLSAEFRSEFLGALEHAFDRSELRFPGHTSHLADPAAFARVLDTVRAKDWVVYSQPPFAGPETVVDYLGRYTHRVAISNHRILDVSDGQVTFTYRDRQDGNVVKTLTLPAEEFIRRFLLHVLPYGFQRIRHYGLFANRYKAQALGRCRAALGLDPDLPKPEPKTPREWILELTGQDVTRCPRCGSGTLRPVRGLAVVGSQGQADAGQEPALHDSS